MNSKTKIKVETRIREKMDNILVKRLKELDSDMTNIRQNNPFGSRLVPNEIWKGSKFERSFVTSFGQGVYEQIALDIAIGSGAFAENQHSEIVKINSWQEEGINNLLSKQRSGANAGTPDWESEVEKIYALDTPRYSEVNTLFDLYVQRDSGTSEYYSIKTVKPNLDQTEIAKRDMLRIRMVKPDSKAYFALPYNPYGEENSYDWKMPYKLFDMNNCPAVLIGSDFWNAIGNDQHTFSELLDIFDDLGEEYHEKIKRDYLG